MLRVANSPRLGWQQAVEARGLTFHTLDGLPYWDESAYYLFESAEIDRIEAATQQLHEMCLQAAGHVIERGRLAELAIPQAFHPFIAQSWERDERSIYGRFDLSYDGLGPPKMLEYNADTPTALLEASVIQWFWLQDLIAQVPSNERSSFDQFNSLHEALIAAWGRVKTQLGPNIHFASLPDLAEDVMTVTYLRDTAVQAGLKTLFIGVSDIGWNPGRRTFTDLREWSIDLIFKLYPWEWMLNESFSQFLPQASTRWLEPPWKMVLSNKAILAILWEMFPGSPYLLPASFEPIGDTYVVKPIHAREGANVSIVEGGEITAESDGPYGDTPVIYQAYQPLADFAGRRPVLGSWIIDGEARGLGIREDDGPITRNTSRFIPHLFRKYAHLKPPTFDPKGEPATGNSGSNNGGVWDRWIDP